MRYHQAVAVALIEALKVRRLQHPAIRYDLAAFSQGTTRLYDRALNQRDVDRAKSGGVRRRPATLFMNARRSITQSADRPARGGTTESTHQWLWRS